MTAEILNLRADAGPPADDVEREAVSTLLETIRNLRADTGLEATGVVVFVVGRSGEDLAYKLAWYVTEDSSRGMCALAGAVMSAEAVRG